MRAIATTFTHADFSFSRVGWRVTALFSLFLLLGLACLWLQGRVVDVSYQIKDLESQIVELNPRIMGLESELARMKSPSSIKGRLLDNEINMVKPFPEHEVHLQDGFGISRFSRPVPRIREAT